MLAAVRSTTVPIMLLHAANDYSTVPGPVRADELAKVGKPLLRYTRPSATLGTMDTILFTPILLNGRKTYSRSSTFTSNVDRSQQYPRLFV